MLSSYLNSQFSLLQNLDFAIRILVACLCGFVLGVERSRRFKEAGVRTHMIVCCGAALIMIVSKYGFADLTSAAGEAFNGTRGADSARLAAQVVSGVSFIGAGIIFKNGGSIKGLTTAAGIWAAAGIGLAIGAGMYFVGILGTVAVALIQMMMHIVTVGQDSFKHCNIDILVENLFDFDDKFRDLMKHYGATIVEFRVTREVRGVRYNATLKSKKAITTDDVTAYLADNKEIIEVSVLTV
ncbi:MAG: MgtC/SapB family protein [Oscillospiraceae bacterium]|nr:MgtC/SapB family protein [Oscillospiraceae bacterium]